VPIATNAPQQTASLFDHLVGDLLEMHRHVEAQRLGGLEVDGKLIPRRRLHRQVARLLALESLASQGGAPSRRGAGCARTQWIRGEFG
jgi:hypothetical protein